jgi:hypothetical protein
MREVMEYGPEGKSEFVYVDGVAREVQIQRVIPLTNDPHNPANQWLFRSVLLMDTLAIIKQGILISAFTINKIDLLAHGVGRNLPLWETSVNLEIGGSGAI